MPHWCNNFINQLIAEVFHTLTYQYFLVVIFINETEIYLSYTVLFLTTNPKMPFEDAGNNFYLKIYIVFWLN